MKTKKARSLCILRGCDRGIKTRGLCSKHYQIAFLDVLMGRETWLDLHNKKKAIVVYFKNEKDEKQVISRDEEIFDEYKRKHTLAGAAKKFGISHERVRQILSKKFPDYKKYGRQALSWELKECAACGQFFKKSKKLNQPTCSIECGGVYRRLFDIPVYKMPPERFRKYNRERHKKYYAGKGRNIIKAIVKKQYKKFPTETRARTLLNRAVRTGKIKKPTKCSRCPQNKLRITGHHPNYKKPLEVIWLCDVCHKAEHRRIDSKAI